MDPALILFVNRASITSLGSLAAGCVASAVRAGVWAGGGAASFGKRLLVRFAGVRVGACAGGLVAGHSRPVHAPCPSFHSSGSPAAPAEFQRSAPF